MNCDHGSIKSFLSKSHHSGILTTPPGSSFGLTRPGPYLNRRRAITPLIMVTSIEKLHVQNHLSSLAKLLSKNGVTLPFSTCYTHEQGLTLININKCQQCSNNSIIGLSNSECIAHSKVRSRSYQFSGSWTLLTHTGSTGELISMVLKRKLSEKCVSNVP